MKRLIALLLAVIPAFHVTQGQNIEGQLIASQYGQWRVQGYAPDTYTFAPTSCRVQGGGSFFYAFTAGTPIRIVDGNPALSETVTPSSVVENNDTCSISINPVNHHNVPFYLTSATGGLQEAIHANNTAPEANTIILSNTWYQIGGTSSVIAGVKGVAELGLVDVTTLPSTWYRWNGTAYVAVPVGDSVSSVLGRTGAVTAEAGDYTCDQVTNCDPAPQLGWQGEFETAQGASDATAFVTSLSGGTLFPAEGYYYVDSEWQHFSSAVSLGSNNYELLDVERGLFGTTTAAHEVNAEIMGAVQVISDPRIGPTFFVGGSPTEPFTSIGCQFGTNLNAEIFLEIGCPYDGFNFFNGGSFASTTKNQNYIAGSVSVGSGGNNFDQNFEDSYFPIAHSGQVLQTGVANQYTAAVGFGSGISGSVKAVQPPSAQAPILNPAFVPAGSTTYTYQCNGVDEDGNNIPGTPTSLTDLAPSAWPTGGEIYVICGPIPGAVNVTVWRTAGEPNTGLLGTLPGTSGIFQDHYATATSGSPNPTNTAIPKLCTNGEQWCAVSGTNVTPPYTCSSARQGWEYHNVSATATPFVEICNGTSWVTAY